VRCAFQRTLLRMPRAVVLATCFLPTSWPLQIFLVTLGLELFGSQQADNGAKADLRKVKETHNHLLKERRGFFASQQS